MPTLIRRPFKRIRQTPTSTSTQPAGSSVAAAATSLSATTRVEVEELDTMDSARDKKLFEQPKSTHLGECPLCFLPMPTDRNQIIMNSCCSRLQCNGCAYAHQKREKRLGLEQSCAFCRKPLQKNKEEEIIANKMGRVKTNNTVAIHALGCHYEKKGDYEKAFEYYMKAAGKGNADAHFLLSTWYEEGKGVEKNFEKEVYHLEEAAKRGHLGARHNLAQYESISGNTEIAVKHYIIGANLGDDGALEAVKTSFALGFVSKEDFEATLRGHQAAVDATKSKQREEAEKAILLEGLLC